MVQNGDDDSDIIVDMEAGLEHLSRGTGRHLSRFVAVLEPYYRSMETARRVALLAKELGIEDVVVLANKVRDDEDRRAIAEFCAAHDLKLVGEVPYDPSLIATERNGDAPVEQQPPGVAVTAIRALVGTLA
ncbi:MAG: hypothetical protein ABIZ91_07180 [Gemmatimonadaceae bacterium]